MPPVRGTICCTALCLERHPVASKWGPVYLLDVGCLVPLLERRTSPIAPGMGLCLPFWGAVLVLLAPLWAVSGVYLHVSQEGSSHPKQGPHFCPFFPGDGKVSHYSLALPQPSRPHCVSRRPRVSGSDSIRTGVPALSLPSPSCPAPPWFPCSAPAPTPLPSPPTS